MSNALANFHIEDHSPAGNDATLNEIADYYGEQLYEMREVIASLVDWLNCADIPEEWMRCRDRAKKALRLINIDWTIGTPIT